MAKHTFNRKDRFYHLAKKEGYVARSAYKIIELDERFKIFKRNGVVVDLGCAPGGWLQVAEERLTGHSKLVGIDLLPLKFTPKKHTSFLQDDFTTQESQTWIEEKIPQGADWILSDMSPNLSGIKFRDQHDSVELVRIALHFAAKNLKPEGSFLCKVFPGKELEEFRPEMKQKFKKIVTVIPDATRKSSTEVYVVGIGKKEI